MPWRSRSDYSVSVKLISKSERNSWRWEIHRAGQRDPVVKSPSLFRTAGEANRAGKTALEEFVGKIFVGR